jgi:hypothetical protein
MTGRPLCAKTGCGRPARYGTVYCGAHIPEPTPLRPTCPYCGDLYNWLDHYRYGQCEYCHADEPNRALRDWDEAPW